MRGRDPRNRNTLGARRSRFRLIRLLLTESLILATGRVAGYLVGSGFIEWFHTKQNLIFLDELPNSIPFQMDNRVLLSCVGMAVFSALLCGLAPALQSTRVDLVSALKSADVDIPQCKRVWGRNLLVVVQVSMSLMLLTGAFLMARGFQHSLLRAPDSPKTIC